MSLVTRILRSPHLQRALDAAERSSLISRSFCLACDRTHWDGGDHTPDGFVACDGCDEAATVVTEADGHYWHLCGACD